MESINANLLWLIAGTFGALAVGTGVRLVALRNSTADIVQKRLGSLKVWWVLALLLSVAVIFDHVGATILLAVASFLGIREFLRLIGTRKEIGTAAIGCLTVCGAIHYLLIGTGQIEFAKWFLPVTGIVLIGAVRAPTCSPKAYIRTTAGIFWGAMLLIYAFSHALFLFSVDSQTGSSSEPAVGPAGWFLFLVLLTEMNDIMQAVVGRKFGKTKITPKVSPNKSLEGLAGGVVTSVALALVLAPMLTTLTVGRGIFDGILISALAGMLISLTGFLGDINMSAIKRDAGVKDGSAILPGMGGIIDRIDSLIFTAPVFYYFVLIVGRLN